jgi:Zn-dependent protease with chaperone function
MKIATTERPALMSKRTLFLFGFSLLATLFIPSCSYWVASGIQSNFDRQFVKQAKTEGVELSEGFSITQICSDSSRVYEEPALKPICAELEQFNTLEYWAIVVGLVGLGFLASVLLAGLISRGSRNLLVMIFKPGLKLSQVAIAFLVLGHGLLMVSSIYYFESFWLKRVHFVLIAGAGLITIIASLRILASLFTNFRKTEANVFGVSLSRTDAPKLWTIIDEVSAFAKTESPTNLLVGMSPNFFVTEANVRAIDGVFNGRTLYLSIPFCRLLSIPELKAIVGHELGHFVGLDTKFSRHFYPIYRGAQESLGILHSHNEGEGGLHSIALLPAIFMMSFFMNTFEQIETKIGRDRELEADALAGRICGKEKIASALVKVHAFANVWPYIEKDAGVHG